MKLTNDQKKALSYFKKYNYVAVDAPRGSGKTTFLKEIIKLHPKNKIGIYCKYKMFKLQYATYKNCIYLPALLIPNNLNIDILLADEEFIPIGATLIPVACAFTRKYPIVRWGLGDFVNIRMIEEARKILSPLVFESEFGQYL